MNGRSLGDQPYLVTDVVGLRKLTTSPPVYYVTVEGREVELEYNQLLKWDKFREAVFVQADVIVEMFLAGFRSQPAWEHCLRELVAAIQYDEAPADASLTGMILDEVRTALRSFEVVDDAAELDGRAVMTRVADGAAFRGKYLFNRLVVHQALAGLTMPKLWRALRAGGFRHRLERCGAAGLLKVWIAPPAFLAPEEETASDD